PRIRKAASPGVRAARPGSAPQERGQRIRAEGPGKLPAVGLVPQHRNARTVARLQRLVAVDEHAFELRRARLGQGLEGEVAEMAVVALEQDQGHMADGTL